MYECPNCGGNLKFDVASQQLSCAYCDVRIDPYKVEKEKDAEESHFYEVTTFTCPQCGGEIFSTDNSAAGFCSYCGASTILNSRISQELRPQYIIPFTKTKEDCKKAYEKIMRRAIFAPRALKDKKHIDGFRGIYMPYWMYSVSQKGFLQLKGVKEHRSGDYIIKDYYNLEGDLDMSYDGMSHDASAAFADEISERIAPYDIKRIKPFTPSFLSGFYADNSDIDRDLYENDMVNKANEHTKDYLSHHILIRQYNIEKYNNPTDKFHTHCDSAEQALFPVWFLSYRNGNRIAYATVNGQTGKVVADIPIDIGKYLIGSLLLAVPIFICFNLFLTLRPKILLIIVAILALLAVILHVVEMKAIIKKEDNQDDKGLVDAKKKQIKRKWNMENNGPIDLATGAQKKKKLQRKMWSGSVGATVAMIICVVIILLNPVSDLYYYGGALISMLGIFCTCTSLIRHYNILSTRELPQFEHRGGDDSAE